MARRMPPRISIVMAIISFVVAAIPATGLVMKTDVTGRFIVTAVWVLIGIAWLGQLIHAKKSSPR